jgi:hypothetical protein
VLSACRTCLWRIASRASGSRGRQNASIPRSSDGGLDQHERGTRSLMKLFVSIARLVDRKSGMDCPDGARRNC